MELTSSNKEKHPQYHFLKVFQNLVILPFILITIYEAFRIITLKEHN